MNHEKKDKRGDFISVKTKEGEKEEGRQAIKAFNYPSTYIFKPDETLCLLHNITSCNSFQCW